MMKNRSLRLAFALVPFCFFGALPAGVAKADAPSATQLLSTEPLVWMDNCPYDARHPHAMRCLSRRLVPQSYAQARKVGPFTPAPDAGVGVDAGADIVWCDGVVGGGGFSGSPAGLEPANYVKAYNIPTTPTGAGKVVAIVDACAETTVVADLAVYRAKFGLPALPECGGASGNAPTPGGTACFGVVSQRGDGALPPADDGWAGEIALDVEMVSAACPDCSILLVEADSPNSWDLGPAVNEAVSLGASAVSNSYGGIEDPNDPLGVNYSDGLYAQYYEHDGVLITVASGDWAYDDSEYPGPYPGGTSYLAPSFPSTVPSVLSVGGTDLATATGTRGYTESVWPESSSGCSTEFPKPAYQTGVPMGSCTTMRGDVDVAAAASGVTTYGGGGWSNGVAGTSCASPFVAGLLTRVGMASQANEFFYTHTSAFYDVTTGNNEGTTTCPDLMCKAGVGWDGPTGWGSPNGAALAALDADAGGADAGIDAGHGTDAGEPKDATTETDASGATDATLGNGDASGGEDASGNEDSGASGSGSGGGSGSGSGGGSGSGSGGGSSSGGSSGGGVEDSGPIIIASGESSTGDDEGGNGATGNSNGCGCTTVGDSSSSSSGGLALFALGGLVVARRRRRR